MLRLSRLTDYGVVVLVQLGQESCVQTAPGIARSTGIPEPTVAKVLKMLSAGELVVSQRGARGGYRLHRPLAQMRIADVVIALDGPIAVTSCVENGSCEAQTLCPVHGRWAQVNDAIHAALMSISMADMARPAFHVPAQDVSGAPLQPSA